MTCQHTPDQCRDINGTLICQCRTYLGKGDSVRPGREKWYKAIPQMDHAKINRENKLPTPTWNRTDQLFRRDGTFRRTYSELKH